MRMTKGFSDKTRPFRFGQKKKPARKRAANVSIDAEVLAEAKTMGINLSQTLEDELRKQVRQAKIDRWSEENKEAIDSYNRFIEEHGIWSEEYHSWLIDTGANQFDLAGSICCSPVVEHAHLQNLPQGGMDAGRARRALCRLHEGPRRSLHAFLDGRASARHVGALLRGCERSGACGRDGGHAWSCPEI